MQEQTGTTTANLLTGLNVDEYFRRTDSQGARDFITDALGSTLALTTSSGAITTRYIYDPYGNTITSGQVSSNPYQYTGRENDGMGHYYYRARYYSPVHQRFISEDPIGFAGGDTNLMRYVGNNPLLWVDPRGLASDSCCREKTCRVVCTGAPGYPAVICTRYEKSCGKVEYTNLGLYQWLDRNFNFIGVFSCDEFDHLLRSQSPFPDAPNI